ncbi:hypothetical protein [Streptomyces phaeofaciens]
MSIIRRAGPADSFAAPEADAVEAVEAVEAGAVGFAEDEAASSLHAVRVAAVITSRAAGSAHRVRRRSGMFFMGMVLL